MVTPLSGDRASTADAIIAAAAENNIPGSPPTFGLRVLDWFSQASAVGDEMPPSPGGASTSVNPCDAAGMSSGCVPISPFEFSGGSNPGGEFMVNASIVNCQCYTGSQSIVTWHLLAILDHGVPLLDLLMTIEVMPSRPSCASSGGEARSQCEEHSIKDIAFAA